jgi:hypothetical protein
MLDSFHFLQLGSGLGKCLLLTSCDSEERSALAALAGGGKFSEVDFAGSDSLISDSSYAK